MSADQQGKPLPASTEAEEAFLGACLLNSVDIVEAAIAAGISGESFFSPGARILWETILELHRRRLSIEAGVLDEELKAARKLDAIGGPAFLAQVSNRAPTTSQAEYYVGKLRELQNRRDLITAGRKLAEQAADETQPLADLVATAGDHLRRLGTNPKGVQPFTVWTPAQFAAYQADLSALLLGDGYLERGEWTALVGIGGLGKTRLALWLSICQITGRDWCGLKTHGDPQKTVFLSSENGVRRWKADLEKILATLTEFERSVVEKRLRILALTPDDDGDLCLGNPDTLARLRATLNAEDPGFVIFDPFADMIEGDENKAVDVIATLRALRSLTRAACPTAAVLIVHHARTGAGNVAQAGDNFSAGNFGRGSKALYSRVRCELQLAPQDRDDPNRLVLACGKANNTAKFEPRGLVFDPETFTYSVDSSFNLEAWRNDIAGQRRNPSVTIAEVVEAVREKTPVAGDETTTAEIYEALKDSSVTLRTIQRQLRAAAEMNYLRNGKKRSTWRLGSKPLPK